MLSTASNIAHQQSISHTQDLEQRPHAGTVSLTNRPKSGTKGLENLTAKKHQLQVSVHTDQLQDENLQTYGD